MSDLADRIAARLEAEVGVGYAVDADTIKGEERNIRVEGFDAPETAKRDSPGQPLGDLATRVAQRLLDEGATVGEPTGERTYNRDVASVTRADGEDMAEFMIRQGLGNPTKWSTPEQAEQEQAGFIQRTAMPGMMTGEERQIAAEREQELADRPWEMDLGGYGRDLSTSSGTFQRSLARGVDQLQLLGNATAQAVGEVTGTEFLTEWAEEGIEQNLMEMAANPAKIGDIENIEDFSDFGTWALEVMGEQGPMLMASMTGAGLGAAAARGVIGRQVLKGIGESYAKRTGKELSEQALAGIAKNIVTKRGAAAGAGGASYPLGVGEVQLELKEGGITAPGTALVAGLPIAALDVVGLNAMVGRLFPSVPKEIASDLVGGVGKQVLKAAGVGTAVGAAGEVPTEVAQELVAIMARAYHDPTYEVFSDENLSRLRNVAAAAGLVGGVVGGSTSTVHKAMTAESDDTRMDRELAESELEMEAVGKMREMEEAPGAEIEELSAEGDRHMRAAMAMRQGQEPQFDEDLEITLAPGVSDKANNFLKNTDAEISAYSRLATCLRGG